MAFLGILIYWLPWVLERNVRKALTLGGFGLLLVLFERWLLVPADTGWNLALGFAVNAVLAAFISGGVSMIRRYPDLGGAAPALLKIGAAVIIFISLGVASAEMLHANAYQSLGQVQVQSAGAAALSEIDLKSIVVVPVQTAHNKGQQVVGAYGSQFSVGQYYLQRIKGELVWVAPLEFASWQAQLTAKASPGYVTVSATDALAPAQLHTGYQMRYLADAFWGQWLERHLRSRYPELVFAEASFEVDEAGRPFWVMSAGHYTIGRGAVRIDRAVVLDPQTGDAQSYPLDQMPDWIDQAVPRTVARDYSSWWGQYNGGWWNSAFGKRGVKILTQIGGVQSMVGVNGSDGRFYWFSGMTSPNAADTSLIGYMMTDARTGAMSFHTLPGIASEEYVEGAVANTFKAQRYAAGYPLPYNIYGQFTWAVPVLDSLDNGQLMAVSLLSADGTRILSGKTLDEALRLYKSSLSGGKGVAPTGTAKPEQLNGTVERIAPVADQGATVYYLVLKEKPGRVFSAPLGLSAYLPVTRPGDRVSVTFADTTEALVPVTAFKNLELEP